MNALVHLFPPTIHPMVVHFTIAITYLAALAGFAGLIRRKERTWAQAFWVLLWLGILATLAAGLAGVVSESYVQVPYKIESMLHHHKQYGELTGVLLVLAAIVQWFAQRRSGRISWLAFLLTVAAVVTVSIAGYLGGDMVYDHGLGVHTVHPVQAQTQGRETAW
ncbi:hypothetical protein GCM10010885_19680 [Alicyclobacillus cellulosilyticus]|uniref:DUF2231 domain-containing protein n=1 Tax=Alicyclobacillus cellulosilyticus TaxID=1003997 RepID=A0A917KDV9_9BACL|nr:DUF2231 domain-containing protein [Alicyclobacillus cellulosilyticus]GGJ10536.1 hypothetical protein GCM10010885_19680 [Alicyclobacillus cellulosilyticus]